MGVPGKEAIGPGYVGMQLTCDYWKKPLTVFVPLVVGEDPQITVAKYLGLITSGGSMDGSDVPKLKLAEIRFSDGRSVEKVLTGI